MLLWRVEPVPSSTGARKAVSDSTKSLIIIRTAAPRAPIASRCSNSAAKIFQTQVGSSRGRHSLGGISAGNVGPDVSGSFYFMALWTIWIIDEVAMSIYLIAKCSMK